LAVDREPAEAVVLKASHAPGFPGVGGGES